MRKNDAYVWWNAGVCYVLKYPSQERICFSTNFRRATRKARRLGYRVRVFHSDPKTAPRDAVEVGMGSYVLPPYR